MVYIKVMDGDEVNIRNQEDRAYKSWQYEEKNKVLRMLDPKKKQERWNEIFPPIQPENLSYLEGKVF